MIAQDYNDCQGAAYYAEELKREEDEVVILKASIINNEARKSRCKNRVYEIYLMREHNKLLKKYKEITGKQYGR